MYLPHVDLMKSSMKRSRFGFQTWKFQEHPKSFILSLSLAHPLNLAKYNNKKIADTGAREEIYFCVCWAVRPKPKSSAKRVLSLTHKKSVQSRPQCPLLSSSFIGSCFADKESGTCNVSNKTLLAKINYEQDFLYCRCPNWLSSPM
jgi:hypothetical protein